MQQYCIVASLWVLLYIIYHRNGFLSYHPPLIVLFNSIRFNSFCIKLFYSLHWYQCISNDIKISLQRYQFRWILNFIFKLISIFLLYSYCRGWRHFGKKPIIKIIIIIVIISCLKYVGQNDQLVEKSRNNSLQLSMSTEAVN